MNLINRAISYIFPALFLCSTACNNSPGNDNANKIVPNILFAISDDQSYPHASVYGTRGIITPAFDQLAKEGVLFNNAFTPAPQCSPSRAAILTGRNIWQLEEAGTHGSLFPKKFQVFTDALEQGGYAVGYTGKPWSPGNWEDSGWKRNPVGQEYNMHTHNEVPYSGINDVNYSENFKEFIKRKPGSKPFFFWYGSHEPHRDYEYGSGLKEGKNPGDADLPAFLPDVELVKNDLLDYYVEIEWFDKHLGEMIAFLKEIGEYENTIIVVTADNGMPFPYAKANLQEFGTHVPLLIAGQSFFEGGRKEDGLVSLIDLAPTFLELAKVPEFDGITGKSMLNLITNQQSENGTLHRNYVLTGRERHTHARPDNLGYPSRAIRTSQYLYIINMKPDRWPAGNPAPGNITKPMDTPDIKPIDGGYNDIDNSPTKEFTVKSQDDFRLLFSIAFDKRPEEQLYDINSDPYCLKNLADEPSYLSIKKQLRETLEAELTKQGDPRMFGKGDVFESYPRFGRMRNFPGFKERAEYNPDFMEE